MHDHGVIKAEIQITSAFMEYYSNLVKKREYCVCWGGSHVTV